MRRVHDIRQMTQTKFLNLFELEMLSDQGKESQYFLASRSADTTGLKMNTKKTAADGVIIFSLYGAARDRVVLIRQYRPTINGFIYEFPAGLVEQGEDCYACGVRELKEETGLKFTPAKSPAAYSRPFYTSVGMSDETCAMIFGYADGTVSQEGQEEYEEIDIVLADKEEVRRILKEENVSLMCAYMLMFFLAADPDEPFAFLKEE